MGFIEKFGDGIDTIEEGVEKIIDKGEDLVNNL